MRGFSHGQPQVAAEISEDQVLYNDLANEMLQQLVRDRNAAETDLEFRQAKEAYLDRIYFFRDLLGVKESVSLIV